MAAAAPFIMIAGTMYSVKSGMDAKSAQKQAAAQAEKIGRENAAVIEAESREEMKRAEDKHRKDEATAMSRAAASGIQVKAGDSVNDFLDQVDEAHAESMAWLQKSSENRQRIAIMTGKYQGMQGRAAASATGAQIASNVASSASNVYTAGKAEGWWSTT